MAPICTSGRRQIAGLRHILRSKTPTESVQAISFSLSLSPSLRQSLLLSFYEYCCRRYPTPALDILFPIYLHGRIRYAQPRIRDKIAPPSAERYHRLPTCPAVLPAASESSISTLAGLLVAPMSHGMPLVAIEHRSFRVWCLARFCPIPVEHNATYGAQEAALCEPGCGAVHGALPLRTPAGGEEPHGLGDEDPTEPAASWKLLILAHTAQQTLPFNIPLLPFHQSCDAVALCAQAVGRGCIALQHCSGQGDAAVLSVVDVLSRPS